MMNERNKYEMNCKRYSNDFFYCYFVFALIYEFT